METERVYNMRFSSLYLCLTAEAERKGRSSAGLDRVISWWTRLQKAGPWKKSPAGRMWRGCGAGPGFAAGSCFVGKAAAPERFVVFNKICGLPPARRSGG